jgi:hypothetical protein
LSDCFGKTSASSTSGQADDLPEILKLEAGEMEKASLDAQKNWAKESTEK